MRTKPAAVPADLHPSALDRLIGYVAPKLALDRYRAKVQFAAIEAFTGASMGRRSMRSWVTSRGSADSDLRQQQLDILRRNSRDLYRNVPIATGAVSGVVTSVVGTGLVLQCNVDSDALGWTDAETEDWEATTEREWRGWAESTDCDITRHSDFYGLQDLAFRSTLVNGDTLSLLPFVPRAGAQYDLRVQLVEGDRLANKDFGPDTKNLSSGVAYDDRGAPTAYHVLRTHPGSHVQPGWEWDIVQAFGASTGRRNVLHLFRRTRIGQNRGEPYLTPVIELLKTMGDYTTSEAMAALTSGLFAVFITSEDGGGINGGLPGLSSETGAKTTDEDLKLGYGTVADLKPGEKIETASPGRPNANFDGFVLAISRQIGMGLEIPYEVLVKHFTASYSASRAALIEAWKFYRSRRAWLVQGFCQPVYEAWLEEAITAGRINAPGFFDDVTIRRAYCGSTWHGDAMPQIDPMKEVGAAGERIAIGISDRARETAEITGGDWESTHRQQVREANMRRDAGLESPPAGATARQAAKVAAADGGTDLETAPPSGGKGTAAQQAYHRARNARLGIEAGLVTPAPAHRGTDTPPIATGSSDLDTHADNLRANTARIAAVADMVRDVAMKRIPRESGIALLQLCLGHTQEEAEAMMGPAGSGFIAKQPPLPPAPKPIAFAITRDPENRPTGITQRP